MRVPLFSCLLFVTTFLAAQNANDSIRENKNPSSPRQYKPIERPRDLVPHNEGSMKQPLPRRKVVEILPTPQQQEAPKVADIIGTGKSVEDKISDPWSHALTQRHLNRWYREISGFRVFVDQGFTFGVGGTANHRIDWYGSFGYQFNPIYYVGIGQGYGLSLNSKESSAPSFINTRVNFLDEHTTPFFDLKVGYSLVEGQGVYLNPNVGMSFGKKKRAWNIGLGYSFQKAGIKKYGVKYKYNYHGVSLRATFEFGM